MTSTCTCARAKSFRDSGERLFWANNVYLDPTSKQNKEPKTPECSPKGQYSSCCWGSGCAKDLG